MRAASTVAVLLTLASYVSAGGLGITNWGAPSQLLSKAPALAKSLCSSQGSFMTEFGGNAICSSPQTRTTPSAGLTCPLSWFEHKTAKCCVPATEVSACDCGEGFGFNSGGKKCSQNTSPKCSKNQWFHERSDSCCDNSWGSNPPSGKCPSGKSCPSDWFWHTGDKCCKPNHPRSPAPDCPNWDNHNQCCGGGTQPSQGSGGGGGNNGHPGWSGPGWGNGGHSGHGSGNQGGHHKRDFLGRQQNVIGPISFPQTDLDKMYCPKGLHACSIDTAGGGEWSYECIDFATELESCGGCASTGEGQDCSKIPNALAVGCETGVCTIYSCKSGFSNNGTECVEV